MRRHATAGEVFHLVAKVEPGTTLERCYYLDTAIARARAMSKNCTIFAIDVEQSATRVVGILGKAYWAQTCRCVTAEQIPSWASCAYCNGSTIVAGEACGP